MQEQGVVVDATLLIVWNFWVAAQKIMLLTPALRNLIREDRVVQMYAAIQTEGRLEM